VAIRAASHSASAVERFPVTMTEPGMETSGR
jgi:hypothetical protein